MRSVLDFSTKRADCVTIFGMRNQHRAEAAIEQDNPEGLQYRFCELRYEGERKISGVALKYGDTAKLPLGGKGEVRAGRVRQRRKRRRDAQFPA